MRRQTRMAVVGVESGRTKLPPMEQGASSTLLTRARPTPLVGVAPGHPVAAAILVSATAIISQLILVSQQVGAVIPAARRQEMEMRKVGVAAATTQEVVAAAIKQEVGVVAVLGIKTKMAIRKRAITAKVGVAQEVIKAPARPVMKSQKVRAAAVKKNPRTVAASHMTKAESHMTRAESHVTRVESHVTRVRVAALP